MSLTFPCPGCHAQITVADEYAGRHGQCPRCRQVFEIPLPKEASAESHRPETPTVAVPPADPWAPREEPEPEVAEEEAAPAPKAKPKRTPPPPRPLRLWAWAIGVFAAALMFALLFASVAVLAFWRKPERPPKIERFADVELQKADGVQFGRLDGQRAFLDKGLFRVRSELTANDPADLDHLNSRCKRYEISFEPNINYVIEVDTNEFDCEVRLETLREDVLHVQQGNRGIRTTSINYWPQRREVLVIFVTTPNPAFGRFTLTVRERNAPPPPPP